MGGIYWAGRMRDLALVGFRGEGSAPVLDAMVQACAGDVIEIEGRFGGVGGQGVGGVHGHEGAEPGGFQDASLVMVLDGVDDRIWETPKDKEVCADFGMGGAKDGGFGLGPGHFIDLHEFADFLVIRAGIGQEDEFADVVEEAGEEAFARDLSGGFFEAGNSTRAASRIDAVGPDGADFLGCQAFSAVEVEDLHASDESAEDFDAEDVEGFHGRGDGLRGAELGGVDDLKELGAKAGILLDDAGDVLEIRVIGGNGIGEAREGLGRCGESAGAANESADFAVFNEVGVVNDAGEEFDERTDLEWFGEVAVTDGKAFGDLHAVRKTGDDDAGAFGILADDAVHEFEAVHLRHGEIADDHIELGLFEEGERFLAATRGSDFVVLSEE